MENSTGTLWSVCIGHVKVSSSQETLEKVVTSDLQRLGPWNKLVLKSNLPVFHPHCLFLCLKPVQSFLCLVGLFSTHPMQSLIPSGPF